MKIQNKHKIPKSHLEVIEKLKEIKEKKYKVRIRFY